MNINAVGLSSGNSGGGGGGGDKRVSEWSKRKATRLANRKAPVVKEARPVKVISYDPNAEAGNPGAAIIAREQARSQAVAPRPAGAVQSSDSATVTGYSSQGINDIIKRNLGRPPAPPAPPQPPAPQAPSLPVVSVINDQPGIGSNASGFQENTYYPPVNIPPPVSLPPAQPVSVPPYAEQRNTYGIDIPPPISKQQQLQQEIAENLQAPVPPPFLPSIPSQSQSQPQPQSQQDIMNRVNNSSSYYSQQEPPMKPQAPMIDSYNAVPRANLYNKPSQPPMPLPPSNSAMNSAQIASLTGSATGSVAQGSAGYKQPNYARFSAGPLTEAERIEADKKREQQLQLRRDLDEQINMKNRQVISGGSSGNNNDNLSKSAKLDEYMKKNEERYYMRLIQNVAHNKQCPQIEKMELQDIMKVNPWVRELYEKEMEGEREKERLEKEREQREIEERERIKKLKELEEQERELLKQREIQLEREREQERERERMLEIQRANNPQIYDGYNSDQMIGGNQYAGGYQNQYSGAVNQIPIQNQVMMNQHMPPPQIPPPLPINKIYMGYNNVPSMQNNNNNNNNNNLMNKPVSSRKPQIEELLDKARMLLDNFGVVPRDIMG